MDDRYAETAERVRSGTDDERRAALRNLRFGADATPSVIEAVESALDHEDDETFALAALAIASIGYNKSGAGEWATASLREHMPRSLDALVGEVCTETYADVESDVTAGLLLLGPLAQTALPTLRDWVRTGGGASKVIASLGRSSVFSLDSLYSDLESVDPRRRENTAWAVGWFGRQPERAVSALIPLLEDVDRGVREGATWALGHFGEDAAAAAAPIGAGIVARRLDKHALWALDRIGRMAVEQAGPLAEAYLQEGVSSHERRSVCELLERHGPLARGATVPLLSALSDTDGGVRFRAMSALEAIGGEALLAEGEAVRAALPRLDPETRRRLGAVVRGTGEARLARLDAPPGAAEVAGLGDRLAGLERELREVRQEISVIDRLIFFSDTADELREEKLLEEIAACRVAIADAQARASAFTEPSPSERAAERASVEALLRDVAPTPEAEATLAANRELGALLLRVLRGTEDRRYLVLDLRDAYMGLAMCQVCGGSAKMGRFRLTNTTTDASMRLPFVAAHALHVHGSAAYDGMDEGRGRVDLQALRDLLLTEVSVQPARAALQGLGNRLLPYARSFNHDPPSLPKHITTERVDVFGRGERCEVCGQEEDDAALVVRHRETGETVMVTLLGLHALAIHGSSEFSGRYLHGDVSVERLRAVLGEGEVNE